MSDQSEISFSTKADGSNAIYLTGRYSAPLSNFNRDGTLFSNILTKGMKIYNIMLLFSSIDMLGFKAS